MSYSDAQNVECGGKDCGKRLRFNALGDLEHADGTPLCIACDVVVPGLSLDAGAEVEPQLGEPSRPAWAKLEASHRTRLEPWEDRPKQPWWSGWGTLLIFLVLAVIVCSAAGWVLQHWPSSEY